MLYVYHCMSNNLFKSLAYELLPVLQLSDSFNVETYLVNQWLKYVCQRSYSIRWQQVLHRSLLPALYVYRCDTYCSQRSVSTCIATISLRLQLRSTSRSIMSWEKRVLILIPCLYLIMMHSTIEWRTSYSRMCVQRDNPRA